MNREERVRAVLNGQEPDRIPASVWMHFSQYDQDPRSLAEAMVEFNETYDYDFIKMMPFGAGRRMCPGYALGTHHAEFFVGSLVRELKWLPAEEGETVNMEETVEFTTVMKYPLRARIIPRNN